MAIWAGEGNDWIKLVAQRKPRKEDVIRSLLESMKHAVVKKTEPNGIGPAKKPRDLPLLELGIPEAGQWPTLEIKGDCKTIVDCVNGHAKMKTRVSTVEATQNLLREWWCRGIRLRQGTAERVTHTPFEKTTNKPTCGQTRARKGRVEEWVDTTRITWPEATGLCGFWHGSCDNGNCGSGIVIMACSDLHGWSTFYKKCGPVPGVDSLDAELGGCGMLMDNLCHWIDNCVRQTCA